MSDTEKGNLQPAGAAIYPAVDVGSSRWPVALIREALSALASEGASHARSLQQAAPMSGRDVLLRHLGLQICAIAAVDQISAGERGPVQLRLEVAALLAGAAEDIPTCMKLAGTLRDKAEISGFSQQTFGPWLGKQLASTGKRLLSSVLPDDHPLLGSPFHRVLLTVERRLCDRLTVDFFAGALTRVRLREHVLHAREEKMALVEGVIGLAWADGKPAPEERQLIATLIDVARFDAGERTMLRSTLDSGEVSIARILDGVHGREDALGLLQVLVVTGFIDGNFSASERRFVDEIAQQLGVTEEDAAAVDRQVAKDLSEDRRLRLGISTSKRLGRNLRTRSGAVEKVIRKNMDAIGRELLQTGDLLKLLAKSTRQPLTETENKRMKAQLIDLCKAVPALALFAAPGGSLLLPLLARALPFSLAPSSFRDSEERAF